MRAHEYLFEHSDVRTTLQKLKDVIDHPATEANIRAVAQSKYDLLISQQIIDEIEVVEELPLPSKYPITIHTNVTADLMDQQFVTGVPIGEIYNSIKTLCPTPNFIEFRRSGVVHMTVPPPYHGKSKAEYYEHIMATVPGIRYINSSNAIEDKFGEMQGYVFTLHYV